MLPCAEKRKADKPYGNAYAKPNRKFCRWGVRFRDSGRRRVI